MRRTKSIEQIVGELTGSFDKRFKGASFMFAQSWKICQESYIAVPSAEVFIAVPAHDDANAAVSLVQAYDVMSAREKNIGRTCYTRDIGFDSYVC